jgi:hypothetical protein
MYLAIDDAIYDELRAHFTEDVPDAFRSDSDALVAPWVSGAVVATG